MYKQWVGKNVDLALLSKRIVGFFEGIGFKCKEIHVKKEHGVTGKPFHLKIMCERVVVDVFGHSNDFSVEFDTGSSRSLLLGSGATLFGGGVFVLRGLELKEALEKLESEFWMFMEDAVARLVGSARNC